MDTELIPPALMVASVVLGSLYALDAAFLYGQLRDEMRYQYIGASTRRWLRGKIRVRLFWILGFTILFSIGAYYA